MDEKGKISGEQGMGCVREGDDGEEGVVGAREEGKIERGEEAAAAAGRRRWGRKQETCFEILICGSGRGLERRDEKKKSGGTFEARECFMHWRSRRSTDGHVGREQLGQVRRSRLTSESPRLHSTSHGLLARRVFRVLPFPSPDTNEMSVVSLLIPGAL